MSVVAQTLKKFINDPADVVKDSLIGLGITVVILRITWQSWGTVRSHSH